MTRLLAGHYLRSRLLRDDDGVSTWLAEDLDSGKPVVIKLYHSLSSASVRRLQDICRLLPSFASDHLAVPLECGHSGEDAFAVLPWHDGETVAERLLSGPLGVTQTVALLSAACVAMEALHVRGLVHGNIKPSNLLADPVPMLLDAGMGSLRAGNLSAIPADALVWLSPEQLGAAAGALTPSSDVYSLGLTLWTGLTGMRPYRGETAGDVLRRQALSSLPPLPAGTPEGLRRLLLRMVALDPRDRPQTVLAVQVDLAGLSDQPPRARASRGTLLPPQFTGRSAELQRLVAAVDASRVALLLGAGGTGKSRLLDEVEGAGRREDRVVLRVNVDAFTHLAHALATQIQREVAAADLEGLEIMAMLRAAVEGGGPGRALRTDAVVRLLGRLAGLRTGLLVLLDDAHLRADDVVAFLRELQGRTADGPIGVVVASRETLRGGDSLRLEVLALGPLPGAEIHRLAVSMLGVADGDVLDVVERASDGNPFLAIECLYGLSEARLLVVDGEGRWRLAGPAHGLLSEGQAGRLAWRVGQLPPQVTDVLATAAILGRRFDPADVMAVSRLPHDEVVSALVAGREAQILWLGRDQTWAFRHDRLWEQALAVLPDDEVRRRHGEVARMLSEQHPHRPGEIAWHFLQSDSPQRAVEAALRAAGEAEAVFDYGAALRYLRMAVAAGPPDVQTLTRLATVLQRTGAYEEAESTVVRTLARAAPDALARARLLTLRAQIAGQKGDRQRFFACLREALEQVGGRLPETRFALAAGLAREVVVQWLRNRRPPARAAVTPAQAAEAAILAANVEMTAADRRSAQTRIYFMFRALNLLERGGADERVALLLAQHSCQAVYLPALRKRCLRYAPRAIAMAAATSQEVARARVLARAANPYMVTADLPRALELNREAEAILSSRGPAWELHVVRVHAAVVEYFMGRLEAAARGGRAAFADALARRDATIIGMALHAWARAALGQLPEEVFEETQPLMTGGNLGWFEWVQARGIVLSAQGRLQEAASLFESAWLQRPGDRFHAGQLPTWLAAAYRRLLEATPPHQGGRRASLLRKARRYGREAVDLGRSYTMYLPHALREAALLAACIGHGARSRSLMEESLACARRHGMAWEEALTLMAWGEMGLSQGWPHAHQARQAGQRLRDRIAPHLQAPGEDGSCVPSQVQALAQAARWLAACATVDAVYDALEAAARRLSGSYQVMVLAGDVPVVVRGSQSWRPELRGLARRTRTAAFDGNAVVVRVGEEGPPVWFCAQVSASEQETLSWARRLAALAVQGLRAVVSRRDLEASGEAERGMRLLYDGMDVGVLLLDLHGRIVGCNRHANVSLGSDIVGLSDDVLIDVDDRETESRLYQSLMQGHVPHYRLDVRCPRLGSAWVQMAVCRVPHEGLVVRTLSRVSYQRVKKLALFQEAERHAIASAVQDTVGDPLCRLMARVSAWRTASTGTLLAAVTDLRSLINNLGHLMFVLRMPAMGETGLPAALTHCLSEFRRLRPDVVFTDVLEVDVPLVSGLSAQCVYRVVLECLESKRHDPALTHVNLRVARMRGAVRATLQTVGGGGPVVSRASRGLVELAGGDLEVLPGQAGVVLVLPAADRTQA